MDRARFGLSAETGLLSFFSSTERVARASSPSPWPIFAPLALTCGKFLSMVTLLNRLVSVHACPSPFYFLDVSFSGHDGAVQQIYLTPAPKEQHNPLMGIWKTHRTSMKWLAALREWQTEQAHSADE